MLFWVALSATRLGELLPFTGGACGRLFCLTGGMLGHTVPFACGLVLPAASALVWLFAVKGRPELGVVGVPVVAILALAIMVVNHGCYEANLYYRAGRGFVDRTQPLVDAINAYARDRGAPPPDLAALVPSYLPALPDPGLWGSTPFAYEHDRRTDQQDVAPCDDWRLSFRVGCATGVEEVDYVPHDRPTEALERLALRWGRGERCWAAVHRDAPLGVRFFLDRLRGVPPRQAAPKRG